MKTNQLWIMAATLLSLAPLSSLVYAQPSTSSVAVPTQTCAECGLPPLAIGAGGLTCAIAAKAFAAPYAPDSGSADPHQFYTYKIDPEEMDGLSLQTISQVYCGNGLPLGIIQQGDQPETLNFQETEQTSVLTDDTSLETDISFTNILGLDLSQNAFDVLTPTGTHDLTFGRYRYARHCWNEHHGWRNYSWQFEHEGDTCSWFIPPSGGFYVKYWCKATAADSSKLLCQVLHQGKTLVGYQVFGIELDQDFSNFDADGWQP